MSQGAVTFLYTGDANSVQKSQHLVTYSPYVLHLQRFVCVSRSLSIICLLYTSPSPRD